MLPRTAATVRRVKKFYEPMIPFLAEFVARDLSQREICNKLNEMGFTNFDRLPLKQPTLSRLIAALRSSGKLPPETVE